MLEATGEESSLEDRAKYIEENAHNMLVKFLKLKIADFEGPMESNSKTVSFLRIALDIVKEKTDFYNKVVKELIEARKRYILKSFSDKHYQIAGSLPSDKLSTLLAWLQQNLKNEINILLSTNLDQDQVSDI